MENVTLPTNPRRTLARSTDGKLVAGVASGAGDFLRIEPNLVRLAFVVLTLAGGLGPLLYAAGWVLLPEAEPGPPGDDPAESRKPPTDWVQAGALGAVTLGAVLLTESAGVQLPGTFVWPVLAAALGTALIVGRSGRPVDDVIAGLVRITRTHQPLDELATRGRGALVRVVIGASLVVGGAAAFLATQGAFTAFGQTFLAVGVVVGGLALIFGPWLWRLSHALVHERGERIRSDERAELAAHLHDSVLQTLAMIQRRADDPRAVVGLARRQERELRAWLFGRAPEAPDLDLASAVEAVAAEAETTHGIPVEVVTVGGACALDTRLRALVLATREAIVNAARHSGAATVAVFVEVEADHVTVFVRDRGRGFDVERIRRDRRGLTESIEGRMARNGGRATVRSRARQGTEIELAMSRARP